jgi:hypothetical protein
MAITRQVYNYKPNIDGVRTYTNRRVRFILSLLPWCAPKAPPRGPQTRRRLRDKQEWVAKLSRRRRRYARGCDYSGLLSLELCARHTLFRHRGRRHRRGRRLLAFLLRAHLVFFRLRLRITVLRPRILLCLTLTLTLRQFWGRPRGRRIRSGAVRPRLRRMARVRGCGRRGRRGWRASAEVEQTRG